MSLILYRQVPKGLILFATAMIVAFYPNKAEAAIIGKADFESSCQRRIMRVRGRVKCNGLSFGLQATRNLDYAFNFVRSPVASGNWAARFELKSDDTDRDKDNQLPIRSEIIFDAGVKTGRGGDDIWYSYKVRIESFTPDNSWEIVGQGGPQHGYWNGGCDSGPPNFSFSPVKLNSTQLAWSFAIRNTSEQAKCRTHKNTISKTWTFDKSPFKLGEWVRVLVNLKSTHEPDGYARIWINDKQVLDYQGPSGFYMADIPLSSSRRSMAIKPAGIYKRGYNRQPNSTERSENLVVYLDDVVFAKNSSYEEVTRSIHSPKSNTYWSKFLSLVEKILHTIEIE